MAPLAARCAPIGGRPVTTYEEAFAAACLAFEAVAARDVA